MLGGIINYEARHCYRESASRVKVLRNTYKSNTAITDHAHTERLLCFLIYLCFKVPKLLTRESHNTSKIFYVLTSGKTFRRLSDANLYSFSILTK